MSRAYTSAIASYELRRCASALDICSDLDVVSPSRLSSSSSSSLFYLSPPTLCIKMSNIAGSYQAADASNLEAGAGHHDVNHGAHAALPGNLNGNGNSTLNGQDKEYHKYNASQNGNGQYKGGAGLHQAVTPGGHAINDELLAIGTAPRRIANPLPLGVMAFATTTLLLSLYNVGVRGITVPNQIVTYALA